MANQSSLEQYISKFPKSRALYERAKGVFVRGVTHDARFRPPFPIFVTHAKGSHEWDVDGYEYIDYYGAHGGMMLGHAHPSIVMAINEQISKGTQYGTSHELEIEWAELIRELIPSAERVEFTSSGTEANMLGIRLARAFTGRNKIIKFRQHFHGLYDPLTVGMSEPWDIPNSSGILTADIENVIVLPGNDEQALEQALSTREISVVILEPIGPSSGITGIARSFYKVLRHLTEKYGTLLLFDEVVTAFRCAPGGVQAVVGVTPDLTSLGKNVTGGIAGAGAIVGRADIMNLLDFKDTEWNRYKRVSHGGTFNGNPLCSAVGIAALKILATGEPQRKANELASILRRGLENAIKQHSIAGCAYGEFSLFIVFFGDCPMRGDCNRKACFNADKVGINVGSAPLINLALNGVLTAKTGRRGFVSAAHTIEDIDRTIEVYNVTLDNMLMEGVLKRGRGGLE